MSGSGVFFQWVPSHRNIAGNEHADTLARNTCFGSIIENVDLEFEDNLRRLNGKLKLDRWSKWNLMRDRNNFMCNVVTDFKMYKWISLNDRMNDVILARFRTGCVGLQKYLYVTRLIDSPLCLYCQQKSESIYHFIFECPSHHTQRRNMIRCLEELTIRPNLINYSLLFTGGGYQDKKRRKIMQIFCKYIKETGRTNL